MIPTSVFRNVVAAHLLTSWLLLPACAAKDGCRCVPAHDCNTASLPWDELNATLGGRLEGDLLLPQEIDASLAFSDPFYLESQPGFSINSGYLGAWNTTSDRATAFAVRAETTAHLQASVRFGTDHNLRVTVKGTGHDSLGRWQAPGSMLIWTHLMQSVSWHPSLDVCGEEVYALKADAGVQFWKLYSESKAHGRFFLAGDCTTVGHVGYTTGGGYGYFSKFYGSAASNAVAAEVVTADGLVVVATPCKNADLLRAVRGGGGGSFGVVKSITYRTFDVPREFGMISLAADSPATSKQDGTTSLAIQEFMNNMRHVVMAKGLLKHIGGDLVVKVEGDIHLGMTYVGISEDTCNALFSNVTRYLRVSCNAAADSLNPAGDLPVSSPYGPPGSWAPDWMSDLTSAFNIQMMNRYFQEDMVRDEASVRRLADGLQEILVPLSPQVGVSEALKLTISFQFALGGASDEVLGRFSDTSTNPEVGSAIAMVWLFWQVLPPHAEHAVAKHAPAYEALRTTNEHRFEDLFGPDAASYMNIGAYHETNWRRRYWGDVGYERLAATKRRYDPAGLFTCRQCVGSEEWSEDGNCRLPGSILEV